MRGGVLLLALMTVGREGRAEQLVVPADGGEPGPVATVRTEVAVRCLRTDARCAGDTAAFRSVALFGLRGGEAATLGQDATATVALASLSRSYVTDREAGVSARAAHFSLLGGGRGGMEYGLGLDLALGLHQPLGRRHGVFSRVGGRGFVLGNPALYASLIELPELQLGYQILDGDLHLELAGHGGPALAGRMNPADERRRLGGSFAWGGLVALGAGPVDLGIELTRVEPHPGEQRGGVDLLAAVLCAGARFLGACLDARLFRGATETSRTRATALLLGVTVGGHGATRGAGR